MFVGPEHTLCIDAGIFILADEGNPCVQPHYRQQPFSMATPYERWHRHLPCGANRAACWCTAQRRRHRGVEFNLIQANNTLTGSSKFLDESGSTSQVALGGCGTFVAMAPSSNKTFAQYQTDGYPMAYAHASNSNSNAASAFAPAYDLGSMYQPTAWVTPNEQSVSPPMR